MKQATHSPIIDTERIQTLMVIVQLCWSLRIPKYEIHSSTQRQRLQTQHQRDIII